MIEVGPGVQRVAVGDRVAAAFFPTWVDGPFGEAHHASALGGSLDGMLAEEVVLPQHAWVKIPSRYSFEQASTLPCAGVTAWHALFEAADVRPGQTVLVQGGGGVSTFALQLARFAARGVATSSSGPKRARPVDGRGTTIDYIADQKWGETARALRKRRVDLVVELGGAGTSDRASRRCALPAEPGASCRHTGQSTRTPSFTRTFAFMACSRSVRCSSGWSALDLSSIIGDRHGVPFENTRAAYEYSPAGRISERSLSASCTGFLVVHAAGRKTEKPFRVRSVGGRSFGRPWRRAALAASAEK